MGRTIQVTLSLRTMLVAAMLILAVSLVGVAACGGPPSSDQVASSKEEQALKQAEAQLGLPNIVNFREKRVLKDIYELRDQDTVVTYIYLENMVPTVVKGHTVLGGKLTFVGEGVGYGIPYSTQYTNPEKVVWPNNGTTYTTIAQAEPNGLFSPSSADGTWVMLRDPSTNTTHAAYIEPKVVVVPFRYPLD